MSEVLDTTESWPVADSRVVLETGRVISIRQDTVVAPSGGGEPFVRDVVVHPGAVGIVAIDERERMLLVRQYRHPVGFRLLEPPAGLLDVDGEDYQAAAARELWEETGMQAADWRVLVDAFTSPGMTTESLRIYLARDLTEVERDFQGVAEEADMEVVWAPLADVVHGVLTGALHNPVLIMGALAAWTTLHGGPADLRPPDAPWTSRR